MNPAVIDLSERVVIVTGSGAGIGATYAEAIADQGGSVVVADIDGEAAAAVAGRIAQSHPDRAVAVTVDVTDEDQVVNLVEEAEAQFGRLDVMVNNAGTYPHVAFENISFADWRHVMAVNLDSVFLCSKAAMAPMYEQGGGKIINVATNLVWSGLADMTHYIAAKAGVVGFTRALAREVGEYRVTVNALAPGPVIPEDIDTSIPNERLDAIVDYQCVKRPQRADDLVGMMLYLCSSASDFVSGQVFTVDGGLTMH